METYFDSFHEDEQISENSYLPTVDEVIKDQLGVLESIKAEEESSISNQYSMGKEDFHQIMPDWQQHVGLLQSIDTEDLGLGLGLGLDCNSDSLNMYPSGSLFDERENSILSKALKSPMRKSSINSDPTPKLLGVSEPKKELVIENINSSAVHVENCQKLCELIKGENGLFGKVTVLNGEKEILEKNIIGLHCLNEIKESPHENCQVASTVINGKRYKIIIKPKSLKVKKLSNDKIKKTLIKKLLQCNLTTPKPQPKEDGIITEMTNGNYDVPILGSDVLPSWDLVNLDSEWNLGLGNMEGESQMSQLPEPEEVKKIPPLRIKIPKPGNKKNKKKVSESKSEEDVDVETVSDRSAEGKTLGSLLKNVEGEVTNVNKKSQSESGSASFEVVRNSENSSIKSMPESNKSSFPKQMIEKIEALKRKRDCRIPLIQAMPTKKSSKCCTRMQDAVATMNRNKLLKIVSGGDTISLDHDYCSSFSRKTSCKQIKKSSYLVEKNPKKDSGMESGDVSDTSEGAITPETANNSQSNNVSNRLLQDHRTFKVENMRQNRDGEDEKIENSPFRNVEPVAVKADLNTTSDSVKTETVSNGNKALTNNVTDSNSGSDKSSDSCISSVTVPSETIIQSESFCKCDVSNAEDVASSDQTQPGQIERPKRKLKLEEYLSRRSVREKEKKMETQKESQAAAAPNEMVAGETSLEVEKKEIKMESESNEINGKSENVDDELKDKNKKETSSLEKKEKKYWRERSRRSSSTSSGGKRESRRDRRSRSRSRWRRSGSSSSNGRKHEGRTKHRRYKRSTSRERKMNFWSGSSSRSPSRESSTSSDYGSSKHSRSSSRYQRRSRSKSSSRGRSKSRNREYSSRSRFSKYYYNKSSTRRRSRSPYYPYSMREKQRQIEERRVIYVGRIEESMTNAKLRKRFSIFGPIIDISLHFREYGDNYGFVTYAYKADAYDAVEHGNDDPSLPRYDLCFGGRRGFCKEKYADLDGMPTSYSGFNDASVYRGAKDSFDLLLKEAQAKLKNRKKH